MRRERRPARPPLAVALLAAGLVAGCSGGAAATSANGSAVTVVPVSARKAVPDLTGPTLGGGTFDLAAHRGHVVVLNVWASWCGPCRSEAPTLEDAATRYRDSGVTFVGLDTQETDQTGSAGRAFVAKYGLTYASIKDTPENSLLLAFRETVPPTAIPSTLVIDAEGRVAARVFGAVTPNILRSVIDPVLGTAASPTASS